jgi:DNA processing protein
MTLRDLIALSLSSVPLHARSLALSGLAETDSPESAAVDLDTLLEWGGSTERADELHERADALLTRAERSGIHAISRLDSRYPGELAHIPDAPAVLWASGALETLQRRAVAIVGSRAATPGGLEIAGQLAFDLARAGVVVVSGLARGCDGAAHRGALQAGGRTLAVVGCGVDVIYPREHRELHARIAASGLVAGEQPPGTPPRRHHFPLRNRLISALSRAVVVVEASERSGSLITAACALEQGREVMAVPGSVAGGRYGGSHALLRDGARLVQSAADILDELGWRPATPARPAAGDPLAAWLAPGEDCDLDELVARSGQPPATVLSLLTELELAGIVKRAAGGRFLRPAR